MEFMSELKYQEITGKIIGAAMKVHAALGNVSQEVIYQRALEIEKEMNVSFERKFCMPVYYKSQKIGERRVDFLIDKKISVELKAIILRACSFSSGQKLFRSLQP